MRPFVYTRVHDLGEAVKAGKGTGQGQVDAPVQYLAGGTTLIDLMKLDVITPANVVDISALTAPHGEIEASASGLKLGAMSLV